MIRTDDLAVTLRSADGTELHFSTTSDDPEKLCTVSSITTKDGTGFESATVILHRDPFKRYDDADLLWEVTIEDAAGKVLHEGAITGRVPEVGRVQISSTGHFSKFKDKSGFACVYRDEDASKWGEMPNTEKARHLAAGTAVDLYSWANGGGALISTPNAETTPVAEASAWYIAPPGTTIARVEYNGAQSLGGPTFGAASIVANVADVYSGGTSEAITATLDNTDRTATFTTPRRYVYVHLYNTTSGTPTAGSYRKYTTIAAIGDHGLTTITPSTVLQHVVDTYCTGLTYDSESITAHPYEIRQLVFEGVDGTAVTAKINAFANWDLNVWEGGRVWYGPSPDLNSPTIILDRERGDLLDPDGRTVSEDYPVNGVECFYTDALTGRVERVGPDDSDLLTSTDDENPCNKQNRDRWGRLDISFVCNEDDAIQIGSVWLAEHLIPSRTGSGKAVGTVLTASGQEIPASNIRAGDVVRFTDEDYGRKVYATQYDPQTQTNTLTFDDAPATLDAILERIGIAVTLLGSK